MNIHEALAAYAAEHLNETNAWYNWQVNHAFLPEGIMLNADANSFHQNVALKFELSKAWQKADPAQRLHLVDYYVAKWGGVRANKPETLHLYATATDDHMGQLGAKGAASWSKVMTMRNPARYAIYDARVAAALNAFQIARQVSDAVYFPVLISRNKQISAANPHLKAYAQQAGWPKLDDATFYTTYLDLLNAVADASQLAERPALHSLEMLLFAKAEELLDQAGFNSEASR